MKKIKLFSHIDLDGYGCVLLMNLLKDTYVDFTILDGSINSLMKIKDYIITNEYKKYDKTFITDLVIDEETIDIINKTEDLDIIVLDHHKTSLWMNKYKWANIRVNGLDEPTCGTELLFEYIKSDLIHIEKNDESLYKNIVNTVQTIKRYDTWLWTLKYNDNKPKYLNDLFYILGGRIFLENIIENNYDVNLIIEKYDFLLKIEQEKINEYVLRKNTELILKEMDGYVLGIVFAEQYQSELGSRLSLLNPNCDMIVMISDLFIRCRTTKENVNCAEFALKFGGAGQVKASGATISNEIKNNIITLILQ